jgi:hypothetical protein
MPSADTIAVSAQLNLIKSVDDRRSADDPFKLPRWLRLQVESDQTALDQSDADTISQGTEQSNRTASVRETLDRLENALRDGFKGIAAIRSTAISDEDRATVFAAYGWSGGLLGRFDAGRIIGLARLGVREHPEVLAKYRYAAEVIADLESALQDYERLVPESVDGAIRGGVQTRNAKLDAAEQTLSQVRYAYCMSSRQTVKSPELLKIGFRPRRAPRTKEEIQESEQRAAARKEELRLKRLQQIDEREEREVKRLTEALENARLSAQRERGNLTGSPTPPASSGSATPAPEAGPRSADHAPLSS